MVAVTATKNHRSGYDQLWQSSLSLAMACTLKQRLIRVWQEGEGSHDRGNQPSAAGGGSDGTQVG
jgi:hypothetical protein